MKHIGLVPSRVNRRPIRYEMKTVSCERGHNRLFLEMHNAALKLPIYLHHSSLNNSFISSRPHTKRDNRSPATESNVCNLY